MIRYWPKAKVKEKDGKIRIQYTYDPAYDIKKALDTLQNWSDFYHFDISEGWIDAEDDNGNITKINAVHVWVATIIGDEGDEENE